MNNFELATKLLSYKILNLSEPPYPINLTLSITGKCNSRCRTCKIWKNKRKRNVTVSDWEKTLSSLGKSPYFITISGGEPFLNDDLVEIVRLVSKHNKPKILNIASNGILTDKIYGAMEKVSSFYKGRITVNLSLDGKKEVHNYVRGVDCFDNVLDTLYSLKTLKNILVGVHSVISKYNANMFIDFYNFVKSELKPYHHIIEIAENRVELNNLKDKIAPETNEYLKVVNYLQAYSIPFSFRVLLRKKYYSLTKEMLNNGHGLRCYAGLASAHISYDGELMACCMNCESLGNIKEHDFKQLWFGKKAAEIRRSIRERNCSCNLANANLTNLTLNWGKLCTL